MYTRLLLLRAVTSPLRRLPGRGRLFIEPMRRMARRLKGTVVINDFDADVKFELDLAGDGDSAVFWYGSRDPVLLAWLEAALSPGATLVDVGAGSGEVTLFAGKRVGPSGRGVAVELEEGPADRLTRSLGLNGFDFVDVLRIPLGAAELRVVGDEDDGRGSSVDALLDEGWFGEIDVLRIAHPEPLAVVRGAAQTIESSQPFVVLEAPVGAGQPGREVLALLERSDYRIYELDRRGRPRAAPLAGLEGERRMIAAPTARRLPVP